MAIGPWSDDIRYYDITPATIHYDINLDAFFIARADIRSPSHPHHLSLVVSVTIRELEANRLTLEEAIALARVLLDRLITDHRASVRSLTARAERVFDFVGTRLR